MSCAPKPGRRYPMPSEAVLPTRKEFLLTIAAASLAPAPAAAQSGWKLLFVVAHPDDEYASPARPTASSGNSNDRPGDRDQRRGRLSLRQPGGVILRPHP